jgi:hypothetical protein
MNERIRQFFEQLANDPVEERVVEYVVREVHNGRRLMDVMADPYVKNRLNDEKADAILENPEVIDALESEIKNAFQMPDIGFSS